MAGAEWIAAECGPTHLRLWAMAGRQVVGDASAAHGVDGRPPGDLEQALLGMAAPWVEAPVEVVLCGMTGGGWPEAPFRPVPCQPLGFAPVAVPAGDRRLALRIVPGLRQAEPPDVMQGEETRIAGFLALNPGFDGVLCLPGPHSRWAQVSAGEIVSFRSFLTGELFTALSCHTALRNSVGAEGWDEAAFGEALDAALSRPEQLAARLFAIRAAALLGTLPPASARARLSGLLIGAELAAARPYWLGQNVAVIGAGTVAGPYAAALRAQGLAPVQADGAAMTREGLIAARALAVGSSA